MDKGFPELESPQKFKFPKPENLYGTPVAPEPKNKSNYKSIELNSDLNEQFDFKNWSSILNSNNDNNLNKQVPILSNTPDDENEPPVLMDLFERFKKFQPEPFEINIHWKPFLPEFLPSIGMVDAFVKVPDPFAEIDPLGLNILDEPSIDQTNSQIYKMELRDKFVVNYENNIDGFIGFIENLENNQKSLDSFLDSIENIYRNRPPPTMVYTNIMPEIEDLMEPWPEQLEQAFKTLPLPNSQLDINFEEYIKIICSIIDIPVKNNIIESLHHLFSLYLMFEGNVYFKTQRPTTGESDKKNNI